MLALPLEIIGLVLESLPRQQDRYHLALSCRCLYDVVQPTIFSNVTLCNQINRARQISTFLFAIIAKPKLADAVRSLDLQCWDTLSSITADERYEESTRCDFKYDSNLTGSLIDEVEITPDEKEEWKADLVSGVSDAWLALTIPRLANLRTISIEWSDDVLHFPRILEIMATQSPSPLPHLEEAFARWFDTEGGADSRLMLPFFKFPAMQKVYGHMIEDDSTESSSEGTSSPAAPCSTVTEINLSLSNVSHGLWEWTEMCKALKSFKMTYGGPTVSYNYSQPHIIYDCLFHHRKSLERIWLEVDDLENSLDEDGRMGSFTEFSALQHLYINLELLTDANNEGGLIRDLGDMLPLESLETLHLWGCSTQDIDWVSEKMEILVHLMPKFKFLCLRIETQFPLDTPEKVCRLEKVLQDAGISFKIVNLSDSWEYIKSLWPHHAGCE